MKLSNVFKRYSRDEITIGLIAMSVVLIHIVLFIVT
jgi:hypothetical protein